MGLPFRPGQLSHYKATDRWPVEVRLTAVGQGGVLLSQALLPVPSLPALASHKPTCKSEVQEGNGRVLTKHKELLRYKVLFLSEADST